MTRTGDRSPDGSRVAHTKRIPQERHDLFSEWGLKKDTDRYSIGSRPIQVSIVLGRSQRPNMPPLRIGHLLYRRGRVRHEANRYAPSSEAESFAASIVAAVTGSAAMAQAQSLAITKQRRHPPRLWEWRTGSARSSPDPRDRPQSRNREDRSPETETQRRAQERSDTGYPNNLHRGL